MDGPLVIGHDVGTGGSKSVLADTDGNILAATFEPYEVSYPGPNRAEQDPDDWWRAVAAGTRRLIGDSGVDPARVTGVGFAGQMIGIVPVDSTGRPLRPAIIWLDSRADEQAARLVRRLGGKRVFALLAGAVASGKDVVCKLAWLKENEPGTFSDTDVFLDTTGYLVLRATGSRVVDHTGAAGTGLLSNRTRRWSPILARLTGAPLDKMPEVRRSIDVVGTLTPEAAQEMGLPRGTPVIAGMADIPAAATGSGALEDGDGHIYIGTSSWLCLSVARPRNVPRCGIVSIASPDPSMFIMLGESETAGMCLEWFAREFATPRERERATGGASLFGILDGVVENVEPGSGRLIFTPWMFGERSPVTDTTLRASFVNLSPDHRREDMLRAIYEGVAYNLRWMLDEVAGKGLPCKVLRAIGGGAKSDVWMQIMADVTMRRIDAVENPQEAGALGCALAVAVALGVCGDYKEIKRMVKVRESFQPRAETRAEYDRLYRAFRSLYKGLSGVCRELNQTGNLDK